MSSQPLDQKKINYQSLKQLENNTITDSEIFNRHTAIFNKLKEKFLEIFPDVEDNEEHDFMSENLYNYLGINNNYENYDYLIKSKIPGILDFLKDLLSISNEDALFFYQQEEASQNSLETIAASLKKQVKNLRTSLNTIISNKFFDNKFDLDFLYCFLSSNMNEELLRQ